MSSKFCHLTCYILRSIEKYTFKHLSSASEDLQPFETHVTNANVQETISCMGFVLWQMKSNEHEDVDQSKILSGFRCQSSFHTPK